MLVYRRVTLVTNGNVLKPQCFLQVLFQVTWEVFLLGTSDGSLGVMKLSISLLVPLLVRYIDDIKI